MGYTDILNTYTNTNALTVASIPDIYSSCYNNYTITTSISCLPMAKLESDSNELKINIKKSQIKFNFNL